MARYSVTTWDSELQEFTPQIGVAEIAVGKWGLRRALQMLIALGYEVHRSCAYSVSVQRI